MANPYSVIHNYDDVPLFKRDFTLIQQALAAKEGALASARTALQNQVNELGNLDILKDVDKEYVSKRLQATVDIANQYAGMDLSDPALSGSLLSTLNQTMDKNVKNALYSTRVYRSEQAAWEKLKEEKPDKYNETNYQYSQQFAMPYLTSDKVGAVYKGGAGVREFVDVNKLLTDKLPEIAQKYKMKFVADGNGGGMFHSIDTYETIPKERVEEMINSMLGPKESEQLRINAWGVYGRLDDAQVKDMYNQFMQPKVKEEKNRIENLRAAANQEKDVIKKQQYLDEITNSESRLNDVINNSYDRLGKEGAYNAIYTSQFKSNFTNAYSYGPVLIDKKVNDIEVASFNANMKIQEFGLKQKEFEFKQIKQAQEMEYKYAALGKQKGSGSSGGQTTLADGTVITLPTTGQLTEQEYGEKLDTDNLKYILDVEERAYNGVANTLDSKGIPREAMQSKEFAWAMKNYHGQKGVSFNYNGKNYNLTLNDDQVKHFNNYNQSMVSNSPYKKQAFNQIDGVVTRTIDRLSKGADYDPTALANFKVMLDKDPNNPNKFIARQVNSEKVGHYYASLIYKKKAGKDLNNVEKANLEMYTMWMMTGDPELSKDAKRLTFNRMQSKFYPNVSNSNDLLPTNWYQAYRSVQPTYESKEDAKIVYGSDARRYLEKIGVIGGLFSTKGANVYPGVFEEDFNTMLNLANSASKGDKKAIAEIDNIKARVVKSKDIVAPSISPMKDYYLSNLGAGDIEYGGSSVGPWSNTEGIDKLLTTSFSTINNNISDIVQKYNLNPSLTTYNYTKDVNPDEYKKLVAHLGLTDAYNKGPLQLIPTTKGKGDPTLTGSFDVYAQTVSGKEDGVTTYQKVKVGTITKENAQNMFGLNVNPNVRSMYDAKFGDEAPIINLGGVSVKTRTPEELKKISVVSGGSLPLDNAQELITYGDKVGQGQIVRQLIGQAKNGNLAFSLESRNGGWFRVVRTDDGREIGAVYQPDLPQELTENQVAEIQSVSPIQNQQVLMSVISEILNNNAINVVNQARDY